MHEQINAYLKRHFGVDDAGRMRCGAVWLRYGTTLKGLMRHHGTTRHFPARDHRSRAGGLVCTRKRCGMRSHASAAGSCCSPMRRPYVDQVLRAPVSGRFSTRCTA